MCVCVEAASTLESGHWQRRMGTILFLFWSLFVEGCGTLAPAGRVTTYYMQR